MPNYDVAVVGAGLSGLAAAALLAKKGKRVIVLEPEQDVGGCLTLHRKDGFLCPTGPALSFGFEREGVLSRLYAELGLTQNASLRSPSYQVILPDHRINVFSELGETREELRREYPRDIDDVARCFRDLGRIAARASRSRFFAYRLRRSRSGPVLDRFGFSRSFRAFLNVQSLAFFGCPVADLPLAALITLTTSSPLSLQGGFRRLADQLLEAVLKNGGTVWYRTGWPAVTNERRRFTTLATAEGPVEAACIIYNIQRGEPSATLFMGLREEGVPVGMHLDLVCLPDYDAPNQYYTLSLSAHNDESRAPRGMRSLCASFPAVPASGVSRDRLVAAVAAVIPFLDRFALFTEQAPARHRGFAFPAGVQFKAVTDGFGTEYFEKGPEGLYVLRDGTGPAVRSIASAWKLVQRLT